MSFILEALRKSEAERRRGQTPDLAAEAAQVEPIAPVVKRDWRTPALVVGAGGLTLLLVLWWLRSPAQPEAVVQRPAPASIAKKTPPRVARLEPRERAYAPTSAPPIAPPPVPRPAELERATPSPQIVEKAAVAKGPAQPAAPASIAKPLAPTQPPTQVAATQPGADRESAPAATAAAMFSSPDVPLRLSDLSSDERRQLPTLKVSMHMWAPDVTNRFAIIDGTRVNEGDKVGEAAVEAIQQDAVMLAWRGRRIRLPIR